MLALQSTGLERELITRSLRRVKDLRQEEALIYARAVRNEIADLLGGK